MKRKYLVYALLPVLGFALLGANAASARGFFGGFGGTLSADEAAERHQTMFAEQAAMLGISVDIVKNGWAEGKSMWEIAEANSITKDTLAAKMKEARIAQMKAHLQALVVKGVITQAQADQRFAFMENREGRMGGKMMFHGPKF